MDKARRALSSAALLAEAADFDAAVDLAYLAIFHAARAGLTTLGQAPDGFGLQDSLSAALRSGLVDAGLLGSEMLTATDTLFALRETIATATATVSADAAIEAIRMATEAVGSVAALPRVAASSGRAATTQQRAPAGIVVAAEALEEGLGIAAKEDGELSQLPPLARHYIEWMRGALADLAQAKAANNAKEYSSIALRLRDKARWAFQNNIMEDLATFSPTLAAEARSLSSRTNTELAALTARVFRTPGPSSELHHEEMTR